MSLFQESEECFKSSLSEGILSAETLCQRGRKRSVDLRKLLLQDLRENSSLQDRSGISLGSLRELSPPKGRDAETNVAKQ